MTDTPVLALDQVFRTYPGTPPVHALKRTSLSVSASDFVAIVGPSGSGKSTLLNILGTLERPDAGTVAIAGLATAGMSDRRLAAIRSTYVGFVFQQSYLLPQLTAVDNVEMGLLYQAVPRRERRERAAEALEHVGLASRMHHRPPQLSGGEAQRVALARAIVSRPSVVLADEPTGNLDSASGHQVLALLQGLHGDGVAVVIVTHNLELAAAASRSIRMADGSVVSGLK